MLETINNYFFSFSKPISEKLLPDIPDNVPLPARKPTLVVNLDDLLVHSMYTPQAGWRIKKRPGADRFIQELSQFYEIVIFSDNHMMVSSKFQAI